jgi:hypothetical protein
MGWAKPNCSKTKNHRGQKIKSVTLDRWTKKCWKTSFFGENLHDLFRSQPPISNSDLTPFSPKPTDLCNKMTISSWFRCRIC